MIGQVELRTQLMYLLDNHTFPRFSIIVGDVGSGKKTITEFIYNWGLGKFKYQLPDMKIDTIRKMIADSYKIKEPTVYILADADTMSVPAKNALLKVTEDVPNNAYFIMTLSDISTMLDTILSRAIIFYMNRYTPAEIDDYARRVLHLDDYDTIELMTNICETPGEVNLLLSHNPKEFYEHVQLVFNHICTASDANVFKLANKIALKAQDSGYDLRLFWKTFTLLSVDAAKNSDNTDDVWKYCNAYSITGKYLRQLGIKSINKQMLLDSWIIEMRGIK